jgi:hypothetical protein
MKNDVLKGYTIKLILHPSKTEEGALNRPRFL